MKRIDYPPQQEWKKWLERPYANNVAVLSSVQHILEEVRQKGDSALRQFSREFDGVDLQDLEVKESELSQAAGRLDTGLRKAIEQAKDNIEKFHRAQLGTVQVVETVPGVQCWRKSLGIEKVGLYIPGGTAPLFSTVLMLAVPATLAGCREIVLCTPCNKEGRIHDAILFAARLAGVHRIYKIGGAQAIAAMAYGTETVGAVYKIFGPGNQYVTAAKQLVQMQGVAIDMPAGPSEVCVLADDSADPDFVAADLLSQAEHGPDSQVLLVSPSPSVIDACLQALASRLKQLPRKEIAQKALEHSRAMVMKDMEEAMDLVNEYAAEHLIISCRNAPDLAEKVRNAGSVFIGHFSPESAGDYASGTNHTLPTNGFARAYSGVSVDSFVKKITYQLLTEQGLRRIAPTIIQMAEAEGLDAHALAVKVRMEAPGGEKA